MTWSWTPLDGVTRGCTVECCGPQEGCGVWDPGRELRWSSYAKLINLQMTRPGHWDRKLLGNKSKAELGEKNGSDCFFRVELRGRNRILHGIYVEYHSTWRVASQDDDDAAGISTAWHCDTLYLGRRVIVMVIHVMEDYYMVV